MKGALVEHLVRFTTTEGREAQHVTASLEDALRFAERLRNNEEASVVRVFRVQEVPIKFKTYHKVELGPLAEDAVEAPTPSEPRQVAKPGPVAPAAVDADAEQSNRKLFSRA